MARAGMNENFDPFDPNDPFDPDDPEVQKMCTFCAYCKKDLAPLLTSAQEVERLKLGYDKTREVKLEIIKTDDSIEVYCEECTRKLSC